MSQFTQEVAGQKTLADYLYVEKDVYPLGRLDRDSEGLLILTNDKYANKQLLDPNSEKRKTYYVQVEGDITDDALFTISKGVTIKLPNKSIYKTLPCTVIKISEPTIPERTPPVRFRAAIPTSWISITIHEGKNRQIRKMFAAVNFPVLRLIRYQFGPWTIDGLGVGEYRLL